MKMKKIIFILVFMSIASLSFAQQNSSVSQDTTNTYRIIKTDGGQLIGKILQQDAREILILTNDNREVYIPQHVIKEIVLVSSSDFNVKGQFIGEDKFATRYFLTTNGLPIKKGEDYVQWNLFGPDLQFAVADNFGLGVMTSWVGVPIIGTAKYSFQFGENTQFAVGGLLGTGSWAALDYGGAVPFGTLSFGDRTKNIAFSGGYGAVWGDGETEGRAITSIAGMIKIGRRVSLVFDSFILLPGKTTSETVTYTYYEYNPSTGNDVLVEETYTETNEKNGLSLLIPGIRWHLGEGKAFQFGFTGVVSDGELLPIPIPMVQYYRSL